MCAVGLLCGVGRPAHAQGGEVRTDVHVVESGQTLYAIAQQYGTTVERLRALNELEGSQIAVGQELRVPATTAPAPEGRHRIQDGETLYGIAARYDVPADSLIAANPDLELSGSLPVDSLLTLPRTFQPIAYDVQRGNTLIGIAEKFGVSVEAIREENGLRGSGLQIGQRLEIPARSVPDPRPPGSTGPAEGTGPVNVFPETYAGRLMASGEPYVPSSLIVSHPDLPLGTAVLLTNPENGRITFARVMDRGPVEEGVLIDVSERIARLLQVRRSESGSVELRVVQRRTAL